MGSEMCIRDSMGAVTFAFYACVCFAAAAFVHAYVPETARKPLADVQAMFKRGLPPTVEYRPMDDDERHVELAEL